MSKTIDLNGNIIGNFDGVSVKSEYGVVLYRIIDGEVYQPIEYTKNGQMLCVGIFNENEAVSNEGDLIFKTS